MALTGYYTIEFLAYVEKAFSGVRGIRQDPEPAGLCLKAKHDVPQLIPKAFHALVPKASSMKVHVTLPQTLNNLLNSSACSFCCSMFLFALSL